MARALLRQATNFHKASRELDEMGPVNGGSDSGGHLKLKSQRRDRALLQIRRFAWNFKEGNSVDFNPEVSALNSAKVVSANMNKRKLDCISPPGTSGLQARSQLPLTCKRSRCSSRCSSSRCSSSRRMHGWGVRDQITWR
jgi:hypothetical protein